MRGFIISLISLALIAITFTYSGSVHNYFLAMERILTLSQPLTFASYFFDEVALHVNLIAGPEIGFFEKNDSMGIRFSDSLPADNITEELSDYENLLEGTIADKLHASISTNLSNISTATRLTVNEKYVYTKNQSTLFFSAPGSTGATAYFINISVDSHRTDFSGFDFNGSGDMNVSLNYFDLNGTIVEEGKLYSDHTYFFHVDYENGSSMEIRMGSRYGESGTIYFEAEDADVLIDFLVLLPEHDSNRKIGYEYDAVMSYSQGNIGLERRIGK